VKILEKAGLWIFILTGFLAIDPRLADPIFLPKQLGASVGLLILWIALRDRISWNPLILPSAIFSAVAVASAILARDIPTAILGFYGQPFGGLVHIALVILAFFAAAAIKQSVIRPLTWAASILSLVVLAQAGGLGIGQYGTEQGRALSLFGSPVFAGAVISALVPIVAWSGLRGRGWIPLAVTLLACFLTYSRGAYLAALGGLLVMGGCLPGRRLAKKAVAGLLVAFGGLFLILCQPGRVKSDVLKGDSIRIAIWRDSLEAIKKAPILGSGPDNFMLAFQEIKSDRFITAAHDDRILPAGAHNDILQAATTIGAAGLLAYGTGLLGLILAGGGLSWAVLASIFIMAKIQPIPPQVWIVLALIAGQSVKTEPIRPEVRRLAWITGLTVLILCAVASAVSWQADQYYNQGRLAIISGRPDRAAYSLMMANNIAPWRSEYSARRCELAWRSIEEAAPARKKELSELSLKVSKRSLWWNPRDPVAHEIAATSLLMAGYLKEAAMEIAIATKLNPKFFFYWLRTAEIAEEMRDFQTMEKAWNEIEKIELAIRREL
jgi:O-antigen ligase